MRHFYLFFFLSMTGAADLAAQQSVTAAGGTGAGLGGTNTFSIGQTVYTEITGSGGSAIQGVQQPFEIFTLDGDKYEHIKLHATIYPNPTRSKVTLKIDMPSPEGYNYELFDLQGRLLAEGKTRDNETIISMDRYPSGTYLLKVRSGAHILKTFKILKNEI